MKKLILLLSLFFLCVTFAAGSEYDRYYEQAGAQMEHVCSPSIPERRVSITDFGAVGDAVTENGAAFKAAIEHLSECGGGHLDVPAGIWLTGPIRLASHIDLCVSEGAIILFSPDKSLYANKDSKRGLSCISAEKCTDISITGGGTLDGNGKYWRYVKRYKVSDEEWKAFKALGGVEVKDMWFPYNLHGIANVTGNPQDEEALRAHMISLIHCEKVLIKDVTVQNSPRFHIVPSKCHNVIIDGVTVRCPWNAQNGDGIDIGNSTTVLVVGCRVDVGDDGICMKGGGGEKGLKAGPCRDILIINNVVNHAHGGFVIGSDVSGGMDNIVVRDCVFSGTDCGLRFKSAVGRGGHTSQIRISNIMMNDIKGAAIGFECAYSDVTYKVVGAPQAGTAFAPDFGDIVIDNVICRGCTNGIKADGIEGLDCVHGVFVKNSVFVSTGSMISLSGGVTLGKSIKLENVR